MKLLVLVGLVLATLALCAVADRPSAPLTPLDWSTVSPPAQITLVATSKDLLVYADASAPAPSPTAKRGSSLSGSPVMSVRRRNADGVYELVGNFTEAASLYAVTNAKWVALFNLGNGIGLFSIDANNQMSNLSTISNSGVEGGFLLSDDTFVGFDSVSPLDDGNYTIRTFEYEASNNTWQEVPGTGLVLTYTNINGYPGLSPYAVTDTHLAALDPTNSSSLVVNIYERQADKSWKFIESVPINSTGVYINYKYDILTVWSQLTDESGAVGTLFVYTKVNGKWNEQMFTASSVGFRPIGLFGVSTTFLDANNILVNAPFEGYNGGNSISSAGKVLLMSRTSDGLWEPAADFSSPTGLFGTGMGVNDYDIVIPNFILDQASSTLSYYITPLCFYEPINVTCNNQQVSDCSQVDLTSLYTVNNPQCGAVTATLGGFGLVNNEAIQAQLSFTKGFGATVMCNATVSCPVPPITVQQTPSKVSSSVVGVQFGLVSVFGFVSFLLM